MGMVDWQFYAGLNSRMYVIVVLFLYSISRNRWNSYSNRYPSQAVKQTSSSSLCYLDTRRICQQWYNPHIFEMSGFVVNFSAFETEISNKFQNINPISQNFSGTVQNLHSGEEITGTFNLSQLMRAGGADESLLKEVAMWHIVWSNFLLPLGPWIMFT